MQGFERLFEYLWICLMTLIRDMWCIKECSETKN